MTKSCQKGCEAGSCPDPCLREQNHYGKHKCIIHCPWNELSDDVSEIAKSHKKRREIVPKTKKPKRRYNPEWEGMKASIDQVILMTEPKTNALKFALYWLASDNFDVEEARIDDKGDYAVLTIKLARPKVKS